MPFQFFPFFLEDLSCLLYTSKAWIPAKSTDKLKSLKNQEGARGRFLSRLEAVLMS